MTKTPQCQQWLRQRAVGRNKSKVQFSKDSIERIQLESSLEGHYGCINCLDWNLSGNLLASGSDDCNVIIWDPFKGTKRTTIKTNHGGNIFSVKFIPKTSDTLIATCASDGRVKLINLLTNEHLMDCESCHRTRVKRLVTHPNQPYLIWSAGEDGHIIQYDIRERHICRYSPRPKNLLINLNQTGLPLAAKCLAINPIRDEMLAIGSSDAYVRLFDRRFQSLNDPFNSCTAYFAPGHMITSSKLDHEKSKSLTSFNYQQSFGTTYVAFSPNGRELLANILMEQVYLFDVFEPWERYKTFEQTVKPLLLGQQTTETTIKSVKSNICRKNKQIFKPFSLWNELRRRQKGGIALIEKHVPLYKRIMQKIETDTKITQAEFDSLDRILAKIQNCSQLYYLRASAMISRGWRGDRYQAIRDACCAFALDPTNYLPLDVIVRASLLLGDVGASQVFLEFIRSIMKDGSPELCASLEPLLLLTEKKVREDENGWANEGSVHVRIDFLADEYETHSMDQHLDPLDQMADSWDEVSPDNYTDHGYTDDPQVDGYVGTFGGRSLSPQRFYSSDSYILGRDLPGLSQQLTELTRMEHKRCSQAFDYSRRFCGHCNMHTDIKEVNFFGLDGEFIVGGSDDGAFYIWDKQTTTIVKAVQGDMQTLNCVQPHPSICMLATSGIESVAKLWSPIGKINRDVQSLETRCSQNQSFMCSDPIDAMLMMLYDENSMENIVINGQ